jgi:hypothetical protein
MLAIQTTRSVTGLSIWPTSMGGHTGFDVYHRGFLLPRVIHCVLWLLARPRHSNALNYRRFTASPCFIDRDESPVACIATTSGRFCFSHLSSLLPLGSVCTGERPLADDQRTPKSARTLRPLSTCMQPIQIDIPCSKHAAELQARCARMLSVGGFGGTGALNRPTRLDWHARSLRTCPGRLSSGDKCSKPILSLDVETVGRTNCR